MRKNQRVWVNQIDMRASVLTSTDEGVASLDTTGDFATLDWRNTKFVDQSFVSTPNADGTWTRRRFYRESNWMEQPSKFSIEQLDAAGRVIGGCDDYEVSSGKEHHRTDNDDFFDRRLRAIQWTNDCASTTDCSTATHFEEEALVELRYASSDHPETFKFDSRTRQLRVTWTANHRAYFIPVEQVANPEWDYGFKIDLAVTTPPAANGTYAPGQLLTVEFTLRDGQGKPLHDPGVLPTFQDFLTGNTPSGIQYWDVTQRVATYYRRKHKEKQMVIAINGPMQDTQTIHNTIDFVGSIITSPEGSVRTASPATEGFYGAANAVPDWPILLGIQPLNSPVDNVVQFTLPADAKPGTYKIVMKARRSYLGEEIPAATVISLQVGTPTPTKKVLDTGPCTSCHKDGSSLSVISHAISANDRDTCTTCHGPLVFEPETPVYVRTHFIHSRTNRLNKPLQKCESCHLNRTGIQRTSKSACMSCHKSYPASHVAQFGPVVDMYIGGTLDDSFQQCTSSCHKTHPGSSL
ncbi:MAG: cytochrome C [Kofleriaceae bacterium]|nr:cytochrome C [Kofleriaceae bacterium]